MTTTPEYDRELISRMLDVCGHPKFTLDAYREQARLLRAADNASARAETVSRPPDARGVVDVEAIRRACQSGKQFWQAGPGYYEEIESMLPALTQQPAAVDELPDCPHSALDGCDCYAALGQENDDA